MPGIGGNNIQEFQARIARFDQAYVVDWNTWLGTAAINRPHQLGVVLRKWQACRPNRMRRTQSVGGHNPPYLEHLVAQSVPYIQALQTFDIRLAASFSQQACAALRALWEIFEQLSFQGRARSGLAGVVGISKAVLLLSDGGVGPAFDSQVRGHLNIATINSANTWIEALRVANQDIHTFEVAQATTLQHAAPNYAHLQSGRIYDMALGPGE